MSSRSPWLLIAPAVLLVGVIYFLPLARVLAISVMEPEPGLGNYALLFTSAPIQRVLGTTLRICLFTTSITLVLAYVVAYVLTHARPTAQRLMMLGVLLPLWMSVLVRAFAWVTLLRRQGLVNNALIGMGVVDEPLALMWNEIGVTIGMVHYMLPLGILPMWSAMRGIDSRVFLLVHRGQCPAMSGRVASGSRMPLHGRRQPGPPRWPPVPRADSASALACRARLCGPCE